MSKVLEYKKCSGLHIVCKKCGKQIEVSNKEYKGCNHPIDRQRYKAEIRHKGRRKTRDLKSLDYNEAVRELTVFRDELTSKIKINPKKQSQEAQPIYEMPEKLIDCILMYGDYLENVGVPRHEQRLRTHKYIRESLGNITKFCDFLKLNKVKVNNLTIKDIDSRMIGHYYEYLEETTTSAASFNHQLKALKIFFNYLINNKGYKINNVMKRVKLRHENPCPISVKDDDFKKILSAINENDSLHVYSNGTKKYMYRPYLKEAFELIAYTGMRIEEAISIKYSDIVLDSDGNIDFVMGVDLKYERAHNYNKTSQPKIVPIPYSTELEDLLIRLDYRSHIGEDRYLIAPDEPISRQSMVKQLSHSFKHYRDKAGVQSQIGLKHLRKTFLTKIETQTGLVESLGYQKTKSVILKNYIDKVVVAKAVKKRGFSIFGND